MATCHVAVRLWVKTVAVVVKTVLELIPFWGIGAFTRFGTYFRWGSGDVHWGLTDLGFDPWPHVAWGLRSTFNPESWNVDAPCFSLSTL